MSYNTAIVEKDPFDDIVVQDDEIKIPDKIEAHRNISQAMADKLMRQPAVLKILLEGGSLKYLEEQTGIPKRCIKAFMRTLPDHLLNEIEARRIIRHMSTRELADEKYLALATAREKLLINARLLQEKPTSIVEERGGPEPGSIESITFALFGPEGARERQKLSDAAKVITVERIREEDDQTGNSQQIGNGRDRLDSDRE